MRERIHTSLSAKPVCCRDPAHGGHQNDLEKNIQHWLRDSYLGKNSSATAPTASASLSVPPPPHTYPCLLTINPKLKFIYVHPPKTGGTSVVHSLGNGCKAPASEWKVRTISLASQCSLHNAFVLLFRFLPEGARWRHTRHVLEGMARFTM